MRDSVPVDTKSGSEVASPSAENNTPDTMGEEETRSEIEKSIGDF